MKKSSLSILILIAALAAGVLFVGATDTASAQESLTPGVPVTGNLTSDAGVNYTLSAATGQLLVISLESDAFDALVIILDADGNELARDDDSGGDGNALLAYVVQADGTFTINAGAWSGTGEFTLTANVIEPMMVDLGGTATLTAEADAEWVYAVFAAPMDTVVNISAMSPSEDDIRLELIGVDAVEIETDDDDGPGYGPLLRRVVLPAEGLYLVKIETTWSDTPFTSPVDVAVEVTEKLLITAEPYVVSLSGEDIGTEVFTFEATYGTVYRITVTSPLGTGVQMNLLDTGSYSTLNFDSGSAVKVAWEWLSDVDGEVRINVHSSFSGDDLTFMIEVVE